MGLVRWYRGGRPIYKKIQSLTQQITTTALCNLLCSIVSRLSLLCCWRNPPKAPPRDSSTSVLKYLQWFYGASQMMSKLRNPEFNSVASPHFWTYLGWLFRVHPYTPAKLNHMPLGVSSYPHFVMSSHLLVIFLPQRESCLSISSRPPPCLTHLSWSRSATTYSKAATLSCAEFLSSSSKFPWHISWLCIAVLSPSVW